MPSVLTGSNDNLHLKTTEVLVSFLIFIFVTAIVVIAINPLEIIKKTRDTKRIDDLSKISSALDRYRADNNWRYPNSISNLYKYITPIPTDPVTERPYGYKVSENNTEYELNANMESQSRQEYEQTDGGDNDKLYEVGTNLSLIQEGLYNNSGQNPKPKGFNLISPKDTEIITGTQNKNDCIINVSFSWEEAKDPGDTITYYYYIDENIYFSNPEITGNTDETSYSLNQTLEDTNCAELDYNLYWTVVAIDSGENTTQSNIHNLKINGTK